MNTYIVDQLYAISAKILNKSNKYRLFVCVLR